MKVVVRSSSLLFTLLSIILHVPIQRVKRGAALDATLPDNESSSVAGGRSRQSHTPEENEPVVTGERRSNS